MISMLTYTEIWLPSAVVLFAVVLMLSKQSEFDFESCDSQGIMVLAYSLLVGSLLLITILGYWLTGKSHPNAIGGLIPWNDAAGYYSCAISVLEGGGLSDFCGRRPIYSLYVSTLSWLSGANLQLTLILQAAVTAGGIALVLRQVLLLWGIGASVVAAAIMIAFSGPFSPTILTENIGFVLGLVGLLLLLNGVTSHSKVYLFLGAFILCLGLNARAGAFLILLTICCWPFLSERQMGSRKIALTASLVLGVLFGFIPSLVFVYLLASDSSVIHSNFSYTLYGLAAGGEKWTYVFSVLPGASPGEIYTAALELIFSNPLLFGIGLFQGFLEYLQRVFSYVDWLPARIPITLFWMWGMATLILARKNDVCLFLLLLYAGVLVSAPVLSIDGDTRVFATTIGVDAMMASYGFYSLSKLIVKDRKRWLLLLLLVCTLSFPSLLFYGDPKAWGVAVVISLFLVFFSQLLMKHGIPSARENNVRVGPGLLSFTAFVVALISFPVIASSVHVMRPVPEAGMAPCQDGQLSVNVDLGKTSPFLSLVSEAETSLWPLAVGIRSFRQHLSSLIAHHEELAKIPQGYSLSLAIDYSSPTKMPRFVHWDHAGYGVLQGRQALCLDYKTSGLKADISRLAKATVIE